MVPRWGREMPWLSVVPCLGIPTGAIVLSPVPSQSFKIHTKPREMSKPNTNVFQSGIPISLIFIILLKVLSH